MNKDILLNIARESITNHFRKKKINKKLLLKKYSQLGEKGAVFVTLRTGDVLRGCIGSLNAHRTLLDDVISNAKASAFEDPRFPVLREKELEQVSIEVSILSKPKEIIYKDKEDLRSKIKPNIDGVVLKLGTHKATFLPQVWEQIPEFDSFFRELCQKAGLEKSVCLKAHPTILTYQVEKVKEVMSIRTMSVAGTFYSKSCKKIKAQIEKFNQKQSPKPKFKPKAIISPHAGYVYSGFTANAAYRLINKKKFKRVVVLGPSHHKPYKGASIALYDQYATPCGNLNMDKKYSQYLIEKYDFLSFSDTLHHEHSTETQMPFIKHYFPNVDVVEIVYGDIGYEKLALIIKEILDDKNTFLVVSTDLSHFYKLQDATKLDSLCIKGVKNLDIGLLESGCEACGLTGVKALVSVASQSQVIDYTTSYDVSGDKRRVVGYLSALLK